MISPTPRTPTWRVLRARAVRESWALRGPVAVERDGWQERRKCAGMRDVFFGTTRSDVKRARAICEGCPVRLDCLAAAHKAEPSTVLHCFGIYGGLTPAERCKGRAA